MSWPMFRKAARDLSWTVFWYALGLVIYIVMLASFYPTLERQREEFERVLQQYPEFLFRIFGIDPQRVLFTSFAGFMHAETFGFIWPATALIFVVLSGAAVVAQEVERGTAEFWLSVPLSRVRLLASKQLALLTGILVIVLTSAVALAASAAAFGGELTGRGLGQLVLALTSFLVAFGGMATLASALTSERSKAAGLVGGVILLMYLAWILSGLAEEARWLRYFSLLTAYDPQAAMLGELAWYKPAIHLLVGLGTGIAALSAFARRDIVT
ncbi:MAG: ABC transporter permease subunit [Thermomicrobium sp.]|nr:ABC transporter permease [Thermomicrobium sp.]MDW8058844.1 ABC transporter permease subunit [Thermomicrobium sp.]